ncbi:MAG: hypothetical protein IPP02_08970 [Chitinophagaceae bacterium]|jgi:hypothetical protein|nr:hypothetical protein [Chitinophagaceae bacterium]MBK7677975.1 hypothetical protein [Chitinophagaceae bacterium]MBK8301290.1 hypothetical protein [Chitinophagaceae bacterium]MBK9466190.1 hypothetical protein [Chitinophagaceae bacterium]MBK9658380.1 hypothetical protein [Chitinophagaceae bacterium]
MCKLLLLITTTFCILQSHAQNVSIGTNNTSNAKLTVEGAVGPVVGLFKNGSGISLSVSSNNENVGLNYADGKAIATGIGGRLLLNNSASTGGIGLQYYSSTTAGATFPTAINVLRHTDNRWAGSGHWIDMLYGQPGRVRTTNQLYTEATGEFNLVPIGIIYFKVTNMHLGSNSTVVIKNAGNGATMSNSILQFVCDPGSPIDVGIVSFILNLDWITKEYDDVYVVGVPSFASFTAETYTSAADFVRRPANQQDWLEVTYMASRLYSDSQFSGTLMLYGNRTLN